MAFVRTKICYNFVIRENISNAFSMPDSTKIYVSVILPLRLDWKPVYYVNVADDSQVAVGHRVSVKFAHKDYVGVIDAVSVTPEMDESRILPVNSIISDIPPVTESELALWHFVADYYLCSLGEVYKAAYPALKIDKEFTDARKKERSMLCLDRKIMAVKARIERARLKAERNIELASRARKLETKEKYLSLAESAKRQMEAAEAEMESLSMPDIHSETENSVADISLSSAQTAAYNKIQGFFAAHKPVLLHGVTGSGKTEIYLKLAKSVLESGRNVLYLVPEIAISRQLEERLGKVFGQKLLIFHSKVTAAGRQAISDKIRSGEYVELGTRSALFLPHHDLGLVIVDEEHDTSYKQDAPAPRYNGRDTAMMLARIHGADVVMGSATPSLESIYNCRSGRAGYVELSERYFGTGKSEIQIISTVDERHKRGMSGSFSYKLIERINQTLSKSGQILILRARRAYSPAVQCTECGEIPKCPHCNVPLNYHSDKNVLMCHYCGWRTRYTGKCSKCGSEMKPIGAGTQKIEEEAAKLFPGARIARLDSDVAASSARETQIIKSFERKEIDILIGTQIIAKGFDFGGISLVAVLQADSFLGQQDFRADERALQLLEQFKGRSGRRGDKGVFVIQTSQPAHPVYSVFGGTDNATATATTTATTTTTASEDAYNRLIDNMMNERYQFGYPPFSRIVKILFKDANEGRIEKMSREFALYVKRKLGLNSVPILQTASSPVSVLGPYSPVVDRQMNQYLRNIRISLKKDANLAERKSVIASAVKAFESEFSYSGHIALDVDPI